MYSVQYTILHVPKRHEVYEYRYNILNKSSKTLWGVNNKLMNLWENLLEILEKKTINFLFGLT